MRFAISIPQDVADGTFDPGEWRSYLERAEALGFDSAWTQDMVLGSVPYLAPTETLTFAAACTERLRLGCAVFVSTLRGPVHLARSLSTLDQISRGRLEIGVAIGGRSRALAAFGVAPEGLVARFTEGLDLMKELWTQPRINHAGQFWQLEDTAMEPKPFQKPYPPIWFGGSRPAALRRAARQGDGFFGAGSTTTAQFADQVSTVREALEQEERDVDGFRIAKRVYIAIGDDADRARQRISDALDRHYGSLGVTGLLPVAVYGPPEACVHGLQAVADAGAEMILLNPMFDDREQMERLAAEVIPHLL